MRRLLSFLVFFTALQAGAQRTWCNPMNLDYGYTPIPAFATWGKHRATADPVIVNYKNDYYLFSTNQWGYWWSPDLSHWNYVARRFLRPWNTGTYDELCAPAVGVMGDTMIVFGSTYTKNFSVWMSTDPKGNDWKPLVDSFEIGGWDPAFFTDDAGKLYFYNGSSNRYPLYGIELDRKTMRPIGSRQEMYLLEPWRYGWQRFGEYLDNTFLDPFIEGSWMTKHHGRYYLQYGAPGTEFSGYADGVVVGDGPLGPFTPQPDPLSWKAGGFARGAGHGATFQDRWNNYWHVSTIGISVKNNFERRLGLWPAGFDSSGVMYCNTAYGDFPHYLPDAPRADGYTPNGDGGFTGWMLLNYNKPVQVSSTLGAYAANNAVDENIKTYWSAASGAAGEWLQSDLGAVSTVRAIQVNYADQDAAFLGKSSGVFHQYVLKSSVDGRRWTVIADKSRNRSDVPHDYVELPAPVSARYIRMENRHMPTGKFALSGLRVFGTAAVVPPEPPATFVVLRTEKDKRSAWIKWAPVDGAVGYTIYLGTEPGKLYSNILLYGVNEYYFKGMDATKTYYFRIESFNEGGVGKRSPLVRAD